tara:strand:- start:866 stop:1174 length:309 start_codon:yes stop_codon:yes gene_type:complete
MKKIVAVLLIIILILFTALIKNSTKNIEDEVFILKENIRVLKKELENAKLEFNYLSSAENLNEFKVSYFGDELTKKDIKQINIIKKQDEYFHIEPLKIYEKK